MTYRSSHPRPSTASNLLKVLEIVARFGTGTTAKDVTDALQMPQATAYRILNSLVADEYLVRTSDLRGFALGHAISGLISAATPPTVSTAARAVVDEFRRGNRFAVHLILFRNASLRIADEDPDYPLHSAFEMLRYPHASAAGKLMLAELDDWSVALPKGTLSKLTAHTIADRDQLAKELVEIRSEGHAKEVSELEEGSASMALPIRLPGHAAGAALCIASPAERFSIICEQVETAGELSARLAPLLF